MKAVYVLVTVILGLFTAFVLKAALFSLSPQEVKVEIQDPPLLEKKVIQDESVKKMSDNKFKSLISKSEVTFIIKGAYLDKKNILHLNSMEDYKADGCESVHVDLNKVHMLQGVKIKALKGKTVRAKAEKVTAYDEIDIE